MLVLLRHLLLNLGLESPEKERTQERMEAVDLLLVAQLLLLGTGLCAVDHPRHGVSEPLLELSVRLEDMWHEEVHQ